MADQPIQQPKAACYVYEILVDGVVRYVGKGSGARAKKHRAEAARINQARARGERIRTSDFYNNLAKALREGGVVDYHIAFDGLTDEEAFAKEAEHIAAIGFDRLWNETPGGDGFRLEQCRDPEVYHSKLMAGVRRSWAGPERRQTASAAASKRWEDPAQREQHSAILRKAWDDEELRARHRERFRKRFASHEEMMEYQRWVARQRAKKFAEKRAHKVAGVTNGYLAFGG